MALQTTDHSAETTAGTRRRLGVFAALIAVAAMIGGASATMTSTPSMARAVRLTVTHSEAGSVRPSTRAVSLRVNVACSMDTVGQIDAVLEQRSTRARAVHSVAMQCGRNPRSFTLRFESRPKRFAPGEAVLRLDASAGFGEQFGQTRIGPIRIVLR